MTHPETQAIRAGRSASGSSLAPVLWPSAAFVSPDAATAARFAKTAGVSEFYGRYGNPTVAAFEEAIAELEGAGRARAFSSGMGAISAVVFGLCSSGDHIVTQRELYAGTQLLFTAVCPRFGIDVTFVDGTDPDAWDAAIRPDLDRFGAIAGPITVVDSTFATPLAQRPLDSGVQLVLHSATKAIGGHNDATLGVVAGDDELVAWLWSYAVLQGANASPFDAMNALRGLRTLPVRLERQSASAQVIAEALEADARIERVWYPGLPSFPQYDLARRQLRYAGGLITFDVVGGREAGQRFVESTEIAQLATSLGGPETLVTHPASTTHAGLLPEELADAGIGEGTIRLSVGLEHADDLLADLRQALDASMRA